MNVRVCLGSVRGRTGDVDEMLGVFNRLLQIVPCSSGFVHFTVCQFDCRLDIWILQEAFLVSTQISLQPAHNSHPQSI